MVRTRLIAVLALMLFSTIIINNVYAESLTFLQGINAVEHVATLNYSKPGASDTDRFQMCFDQPINACKIITGGINGNFYALINFTKTGNTNLDVNPIILNVGTNLPITVTAQITNSTNLYTTTEIVGDEPLDSTYYIDKITVTLPRSCSSYGGDTDKDGICDNWETSTGLKITYPSGGNPNNYFLPCTGANKADPTCPSTDQRDIYIEIDWMKGHKPDPIAIQHVIEALENAPSDDSNKPIKVHLFMDDTPTIGHFPYLVNPGDQALPGFDQIKAKHFGTAYDKANYPSWDVSPYYDYKRKAQVFHYGLWAHAQNGFPTSSGNAELMGNDFIISLGAWDNTVGSTDQQEGTFLHELGHNLGLNHGGAWSDELNCKPNLISVMSYSRQFSDLVPGRALDFSRMVIGTNTAPYIDESDPQPDQGIQSYAGAPGSTGEQKIVFGGSGGIVSYPLNSTGDSIVPWGNGLDIRYIKDSKGNVVCPRPTSTTELMGHDDWSDLDLATKTSNWREGRFVEITPGSSQQGCEQNQNCYYPSSVKRDVGDSVVWINHDSAAHTVTSGSTSGGSTGVFDSGPLSSGESFEFVFDNSGTYDYFCTIHPWAAGSVIVGTSNGKISSKNEIDSFGMVQNEMTFEQIKAARSVRIDMLINEVNKTPDEHLLTGTSKAEIITSLENIRTLLLSGKSHEALEKYLELEKKYDGLDDDDLIIDPTSQQRVHALHIENTKALSAAIPEFGPIAAIILAVAIVSIITVTARSKLSITTRI